VNGKLVWDLDPFAAQSEDYTLLLGQGRRRVGGRINLSSISPLPCRRRQKDASFRVFNPRILNGTEPTDSASLITAMPSSSHGRAVVADVFGNGVQRLGGPAHTGQDIVGNGKYCDVPHMIYPSHFRDGLDRPSAMRRTFHSESMDAFKRSARQRRGIRPGYKAFSVEDSLFAEYPSKFKY